MRSSFGFGYFGGRIYIVVAVVVVAAAAPPGCLVANSTFVVNFLVFVPAVAAVRFFSQYPPLLLYVIVYHQVSPLVVPLPLLPLPPCPSLLPFCHDQELLCMLKVGLRVGKRVGGRVGFRVGSRVGFRVGGRVGDRVGGRVGDRVGGRVGFLVGDRVGIFVGALVGMRVGCFVGVFVGQENVW